MNTNVKKYLAPSNGKLSLANFGTNYNGPLDKKMAQEALSAVKKDLAAYQEKLYVNGKRAVLVIFQAMDAAGKDSLIEHVMSGLNPQGCEVHNFKKPTAEDYRHDFLWRHVVALPKKGMIGIHNRSHYENVLVSKVHPELLLDENLPQIDQLKQLRPSFWKTRYQSINNLERHLTDNGTVILKFFLHLSKSEQKKRLLKRINNPAKHWKFDAADLEERTLWSEYMKAYEKAIAATSSVNAPWYIVPADKKWYTRLVVAEIIKDTLAKLDLELPKLSKKDEQELEIAARRLSEQQQI